MRLRALFRAALPAAFLVVAACGDNAPVPTSVEDAPVASGLLGDVLSKLPLGPVHVLERDEALPSDLVATKTLGPTGGFIVLEEAGLLVYVPPFALGHNTTITVKAPAGDLVGYEFEPHGLRFRRPVVLVQRLDGTEADDDLLHLLRGVYFEGLLESVLNPLELVPLNLFGEAAVLRIDHFSGYAIATN